MATGTDHKKYKFIVDNTHYEYAQPNLTGAQLRALLVNLDPSYAIYLEGTGNEEDTLITDQSSINLSDPHEKRFYTVPPANFGA